jgi:diaminopimelate epimerase
MHGAKNDFVVLDGRKGEPADLAAFARWVCDRHAGIGADGLIVLQESTTADVRMRTINADGSEAEMCGNGIRCAARWLDEAGAGERIRFETDAGTIETEIVTRDPAYLIRAAMGIPRIGRLEVPWLSDAVYVELGNPHAVVFCSDAEAFALEETACRLAQDGFFPNGINVHAAELRGSSMLRVRHWERGVGLTMACGTGAVACSAAAIVKKGAVSPIDVDVPGGRLVVEWDGNGEAYLIGPAVRVFDSEVVDFDAILN